MLHDISGMGSDPPLSHLANKYQFFWDFIFGHIIPCPLRDFVFMNFVELVLIHEKYNREHFKMACRSIFELMISSAMVADLVEKEIKRANEDLQRTETDATGTK